LLGLDNKLKDIVGPSLNGLGYELVRLRLKGSEGQRVLQVMIDRSDEGPVSVEDCAQASRQLSALLDVEDPIGGKYSLEVSSPGIARPLIKERDFERFLGFLAKIELAQAKRGRKRFSGKIVGCHEGFVSILTDYSEENIAISSIASATLVLTDELIALHQKQVTDNGLH